MSINLKNFLKKLSGKTHINDKFGSHKKVAEKLNRRVAALQRKKILIQKMSVLEKFAF